jgi:tetratricopeptide (TPR) repeat protein
MRSVMKRIPFVLTVTMTALVIILICSTFNNRKDVYAEKTTAQNRENLSLASCRQCHAGFYSVWSKSLHGLAVQPYSQKFALSKLSPQAKEIRIGGYGYRTDIEGREGYVIEKGSLPWNSARYRIDHVLGGKNIFYFLTLLEGGRFQILPLAYDVHKKEWVDTASAGIRHAGGKPVYWKDPGYTFNTACSSCHAGRYSMNYDLKNNTYGTVLFEQGINCESCHGPVNEHDMIFRKAAENGIVPEDRKIISIKKFTSAQINSTCAPCHAKMVPITDSFTPGENFFDHYDLSTLEDPGFYSDGCNLADNHTYTRWLMSPCVKSGRLDCLGCHTSGGGYRFTDSAKANDACLPCHAKRVQDISGHTHHKPGSPGSLCISCHMPKTGSARMQSTDHSMLPPVPAATSAFKSPNACTICHADKDAAWADNTVRQWHKDDYQAPFLEREALIDAGRRRDWSKLFDMLAYIQSKDHDDVIACSLLRMLKTCPDMNKVPVFIKALDDPSGLIRSAAAEGLRDVSTSKAIKALFAATDDPIRLVRIKAASVLARYSAQKLTEAEAKSLDRVTGEYLTSLLVHPDLWQSHYNMGNYFLDRGENEDALLAYKTAIRIEPGATAPYVNQSIVYARLHDMTKAEASLNKALKLDPNNADAYFNSGLLKIGQGDVKTAEEDLRTALNDAPTMAAAAYNLSVILSKDRLKEAVAWSKKAYLMQPEAKYGFTFASFLKQDGNWDGAIDVLRQVVASDRTFADAYLLLGEIYEDRGKKRDAAAVYRQGLAVEELLKKDRNRLERKLESLK